MAETRATNSLFFLDEFDLSCETASLSTALTIPALDTTTLCASAMTSIAGLPSAAVTMAGYISGLVAGNVEFEMEASLPGTGSRTIATLYGTDTTGCPAYILDNAFDNDFTTDFPIDGILSVSGGWMTQDGVKRGLRVYNGTISSTGTQSSVDFGAQGTAGGKGWLFVTAITGGATNADIDIESSATEGGVYVSEGTFTFSAVGVQTMTLSGTVDRWLRINTTDLGTATNFAVTIVAQIAGVSG